VKKEAGPNASTARAWRIKRSRAWDPARETRRRNQPEYARGPFSGHKKLRLPGAGL